MIQSDDAPWQIAWTIEEEIALAKGWVAVSKNNKYGNARKEHGFWCEESGAFDEDYINKELNHYQVKTGNTFKHRHCWEILKDNSKWITQKLLKFTTKSEEGNKRHKSSDSSSFNTESGDASINLNTNVGDNGEDEVQEIRRIVDRDKTRAAAKNKGSKALRSSTMNDDALARLLVTEMITQKKEERLAFIEIKMRKVECRKLEVAAQEYRAHQEDIRFYLQPYDHLTGDQRMVMDEARSTIKAKYNLQY
ncbi:hypothetical protein Tco_1117051 [Tanacetum coccineum]